MHEDFPLPEWMRTGSVSPPPPMPSVPVYNPLPPVPPAGVTLPSMPNFLASSLASPMVGTFVVPGTKSVVKHGSEAYKEGLQYIQDRRSGKETSIRTPWSSINEATLNGLGWNTISVLGARPSHGKTAFSTQLTRDAFVLNPTTDMAVLDFQFEMLGRDMATREFSMHSGRTMKHLYSAEAGVVLTDADLQYLQNYADGAGQRPIYYTEDPATVEEFKLIVAETCNQLRGKKLLVTVDHTVLTKKNKGESSKHETLNNLAEAMTELKKTLPVSFIALSQLNRDCESPDRLNPGTAGNYLKSTDIFGAEAFNQHADLVLALSIPARLNLPLYGPDKFIVDKNLMAVHILKARSSEVGLTFLEADFRRMKLTQIGHPDRFTGTTPSGAGSKPNAFTKNNSTGFSA